MDGRISAMPPRASIAKNMQCSGKQSATPLESAGGTESTKAPSPLRFAGALHMVLRPSGLTPDSPILFSVLNSGA
jgi:hypothetical protein